MILNNNLINIKLKKKIIQQADINAKIEKNKEDALVKSYLEILKHLITKDLALGDQITANAMHAVLLEKCPPNFLKVEYEWKSIFQKEIRNRKTALDNLDNKSKRKKK